MAQPISITEILLRFSYPKQPGDSPWSVADVRGPAFYHPFQPADPVGPPPTPMGGGQALVPQDFGLQSFDIVLAGMASQDGKFMVQAIPLMFVDGSTMGNDTFDKFLLMWIDLSTMQQVAAGEDLSQSAVRLLAIGH